jgi:hypothetical protein
MVPTAELPPGIPLTDQMTRLAAVLAGINLKRSSSDRDIGEGLGLAGRPPTTGRRKLPDTVAENCCSSPARISAASGAIVTDKDLEGWAAVKEDDVVPRVTAPHP